MPDSACDDQTVRPRCSLGPGLVLTWLTSSAVLGYLCRNSLGISERAIHADLKLTEAQSGIMLGAFFWSYAVCQLPAGWCAARWGTRRMLACCAAGWSLGTLLTACSPSLHTIVIAQAVMGMAQAGIFPCCVQSISHWIVPERRAFGCGVACVGMQIGASLAALLTGSLLPLLGWRVIFGLYALPGLAWAAAFYLVFRDHPPATVAPTPPSGAPATTSLSRVPRVPVWQLMASSPSLWLLCVQQVGRAAGYMFFASWFPTFLQVTRGATVQEAGRLQSIVFMATMVGNLIGGSAVDWTFRRTGSLWGSRSLLGAACTFACSICILSAYQIDHSWGMVLVVSVGAMLVGAAGPISYVTTIDLGGRHVSTVFSMMNMSGNFSAALTPILIGMYFGKAQGTGAWNSVLWMFAAVYGLSAVCWLGILPHRRIETDRS